MSKFTITRNLRSIRKKHLHVNRTSVIRVCIFAVFIMLTLGMSKMYFQGDSSAQVPDYIWRVRSIDTMKTSRDMARAELANPSFDASIEHEISLIKGLGANYVAIDTPYDDEFLPYLKRWVRIARKHDLKIWYRGNFSRYEGWFGNPKNMSPDELLVETKQFIMGHKELFEDGDIFDPCPECENAGHWPQPGRDADYNSFVKKKHKALQESFEAINKKVIYNWNSIIGGRAKEVLTQSTFDYLDNVVAIDHYVSDPSSYREYVEYFHKHRTNTVISEFGAPIPTTHGPFTPQQQAEFIKHTLDILYSKKANISGVNYWVLSLGTTALYNPDYSPRPVAQVVKDYYSPAIIRGTVRNTVGDGLENVRVSTKDGLNTVATDKKGFYKIVVPAGDVEIAVIGENYSLKDFMMNMDNSEKTTRNVALDPIKPDAIYNLRLKIQNFFN